MIQFSKMKLFFRFCVIFLCLISFIRSDNLVDSAKCERDVENCENVSFQRIEKNVSNVNKNSSEQKTVKSNTLKDLDHVEKQIMLEQTNIQENGN